MEYIQTVGSQNQLASVGSSAEKPAAKSEKLINSSNSPKICKWLDNHVSMDTLGNLRPCCNWDDRDRKDLVKVSDIDSYKNSNFLNSVKKDLENGIFPEGCRDCEEEESYGFESLRIQSARKYKNNRKDAEIKFGNKCNLACSMCGPVNSSLIDLELKKMDSKGIRHKLVQRQQYQFDAWYEDERNLQKLAEFLHDRDEIRFTGGEPTVNNYLQKFCEYLLNYDTKPNLRITTNGNNLPTKLVSILEKFKVEWHFSIDGYKELNEYIRYPSSWEKITKNISTAQQIGDSDVCTTVSWINVRHMEKLGEWIKSNNFNSWEVWPVNSPKEFAPCHAPEEHKQIYIDLCEVYPDLKRSLPAVIRERNVDIFNQGLTYQKHLDKLRGNNLEKFFVSV